MKLLKTFIIFAASTLAQPVGQDQNADTSVDQPASQTQNDDTPVYEDEPEEAAEDETPVADEPADEPADTTDQEEDTSADAPADDSPAATDNGKISVEANAGESDDAANVQEPDETSADEADEDDANDADDAGDANDAGEFDTQTVKTTLTVGEKAHNMCDLGDVDQNTYRCDETEDEFLRCTATCPNGSGIIKQNCECYKYFGPLVLYDPDNCIWNNFEDECFDEDPIPVGGYPDKSDDDCDDCGLAADKIGDEPVNTDSTESTDNPKFMRPVKVVSNEETDGESWFAAEDLDDQAHFSGFLRHLDRWAKLTLVAVEQGEMQPVMYQQL